MVHVGKSSASLVRRVLTLCVIVWSVTVGGSTTQGQERVWRILLLYPYDAGQPASTLAGDAVRKRLLERSPARIQFFADYLDLVRFPDETHRQRTARYLAEKYAQTPPDIIITLNSESQRFATRYRDLFAPNVPIIFCCVTRALIDTDVDRPADVTGFISEFDITKSLELAERLQPDARNLVFVTGASEVDRRWLEMYRRQLAPHEGRFNTTYLIGLPHDELLQRVSQLPRNTIVLLSTIFADGTGRQFVPVEAGAEIAKVASAPTYAPADPYLGRGVVGGFMGTFETAGIETADLALEVLGGKDPRTIPPRSSGGQRFRVDARQLQRWGFAERNLPADTVVYFKEPTLWEQHRDFIITVLAIIALQAVLITALLIQILRRRRVENSLKASERRWRSVFETSTVGIALTDRDTRYLAANEAFQAMLGYSDAELRELSPLDLALEDYRDESRNAHKEIQQGQRQHHEMVSQYRRKDGTPIWVHGYVSTIPGSDSKPQSFVTTTIDITDRKRAEDAMQAAQADLARITRLTTMGELTASIAHEVNQPLTAIVANGNAGQRWLSNPEPNFDQAKAAFKRIVNEGLRASEVISAIRAMFKKDGQAKTWVDVNHLVREVLMLVQSELQKNEVSIRTSLRDGVPRVLADRVQLQQVILNLIMNAAEAMAGISDRERVLQVSAEVRKPSDVLITVEDSGPGIDPKNIDRIFEAFYTTKANGMGMGLSICRSIVESHGGSLSASRGHPHGSVFQVVLPTDSTETSDETAVRGAIRGFRH